mmetsp:Transcript_7560/g.6692  ORF Transcript_7560/g.6692 Transcript_7560/m.6692 type:complete len:231 (-) Transcript_7560:691-1383(-)
MRGTRAIKLQQCKAEESDPGIESPIRFLHKPRSFLEPSFAELDLRSSESICKEINPLDTQTTHKSRGKRKSKRNVSHFIPNPRITEIEFENLNQELENYYDKSMYRRSESSVRNAPNFSVNIKYSLNGPEQQGEMRSASRETQLLKNFLKSRFSKGNSTTRYKNEANTIFLGPSRVKFGQPKSQSKIRLRRIILKANKFTPTQEVKSTYKFESFKNYAKRLKSEKKIRDK